MGFYLYETHVHTSEASACATGSGAGMVRAFASLGYSGMIVTDHFFNGNTSIPAWLPWEARVERFCRGYENALKEGEKIGFDVFFGWEYTFFGTDFLTYGLDKEFLFDHPDILKWSLRDYFRIVHENGGFITHAHPFRKAIYISEIRLFPDDVDAVEVFNASHTDPEFNDQALAYAQKHGLIQTSGSDAHHEDMIPGGGMAFTNRLSSIHDFIRAVKSKTGYRLLGVDGCAKASLAEGGGGEAAGRRATPPITS